MSPIFATYMNFDYWYLTLLFYCSIITFGYCFVLNYNAGIGLLLRHSHIGVAQFVG